jgi:hypothetical protein
VNQIRKIFKTFHLSTPEAAKRDPHIDEIIASKYNPEVITNFVNKDPELKTSLGILEAARKSTLIKELTQGNSTLSSAPTIPNLFSKALDNLGDNNLDLPTSQIYLNQARGKILENRLQDTPLGKLVLRTINNFNQSLNKPSQVTTELETPEGKQEMDKELETTIGDLKKILTTGLEDIQKLKTTTPPGTEVISAAKAAVSKALIEEYKVPPQYIPQAFKTDKPVNQLETEKPSPTPDKLSMLKKLAVPAAAIVLNTSALGVGLEIPEYTTFDPKTPIDLTAQTRVVPLRGKASESSFPSSISPLSTENNKGTTVLGVKPFEPKAFLNIPLGKDDPISQQIKAMNPFKYLTPEQRLVLEKAFLKTDKLF